MDLFLIRHAEAAEPSLYDEDSERPLTAAGRQVALRVGAALKARDVGFDCVVVSPYVRAVQTAELMLVSLGWDGQVAVSAELVPGGRAHKTEKHIIARAAEDGVARLALVGHEPSMGALLSLLVSQKGLSLSKGAVVKLHYGSPTKIEWTLDPRRL